MHKNMFSKTMEFQESEILPDIDEGISSEGKIWSKRQIKSYRKLMAQYQNSPVSYFRQFILRQISLSPKIMQALFQSYQIFNFLAQSLMMSELELVLWSILIEKMPKEKLIANPILMIAMAGLKSKMVLNDDYKPFLCLLNSIIPNFVVSFRFYLDIFSDETEVTIKDLNKCYNEMVYTSWKNAQVNYKNLVDRIVFKKKRKERALPNDNFPFAKCPEIELDQELELFEYFNGEDFPSI
ncbi:unnamed protein product [Blepharisma stoltei]|uniref:Uncharacterized protein n=1 Tax=Blepharisma stoltei TaxID=1481888 RepID=A0AAU9JGQ4_9CILI|nr:unnamed protein product [Blepharisma stoltei]